MTTDIAVVCAAIPSEILPDLRKRTFAGHQLPQFIRDGGANEGVRYRLAPPTRHISIIANYIEGYEYAGAFLVALLLATTIHARELATGNHRAPDVIARVLERRGWPRLAPILVARVLIRVTQVPLTLFAASAFYRLPYEHDE